MIWNKERSTTSVAVATGLCLAVLLAGISVMGLQGCRQLEQGADTTANEDRGQISFQDQLPGCWKLRVTAQGAQRDSLRSWLPEGSLPSIVELDTTRAGSANRDSVYEARSHGGSPAGQSFSVWRYSRGDSIRIQRAGALSGTMLQLKPTGETLVGNVVVFTDAQGIGRGRSLGSGDFRRRGAVEAVPVECPRE